MRLRKILVPIDYSDHSYQALQERLSVDVQVAVGKPAAGILRVAQDEAVDLIVMGTHGRTGLSHALLGSVAEKMVRTAPCPVFTVRVGQTSRPEP